jgi:peptidoglycan hydrolase-like protein with peptidoglycan-binding domain
MKATGYGALLSLALASSFACTHTRTAASPATEERAAEKADNEPSDGDSKGDSKDSKQDGKSDGDRSEQPGASEAGSGQASDGASKDGKAKDKAAPKKEDGEVDPEDIDVATTPQGMLEPGALDKVRDKLGVAKGESVQAAVRRFQREQNLPATGMLDEETIERLGLSPDEIFEH